MAKKQVSVRVSLDLHAHLRDSAKAQGASLNQYLAEILAGASGFKLPEGK